MVVYRSQVCSILVRDEIGPMFYLGKETQSRNSSQLQTHILLQLETGASSGFGTSSDCCVIIAFLSVIRLLSNTA